MSPTVVILIGFVLLLTPTLMIRWDGGDPHDDNDFIRWLMNQPLQSLIVYSFMVHVGLWMIGAGIGYAFHPR